MEFLGFQGKLSMLEIVPHLRTRLAWFRPFEDISSFSQKIHPSTIDCVLRRSSPLASDRKCDSSFLWATVE
jgi:hypothetical protein